MSLVGAEIRNGLTRGVGGVNGREEEGSMGGGVKASQRGRGVLMREEDSG